MPGKDQGGGVDVIGLLYLVCILAALFIPALLARSDPPPGPSDPGTDEGGWGKGPRHPPASPRPPQGGIPLPDSVPARVRLRDHRRLAAHLPARERRPARAPSRAPVRTR